MRTLAILIVAVASAGPAVAQEVDTVLGPDTESYFYAAAVAKLSEVDSEFATYLGFNLGWVFDEKFSLGFGMYGLAHPTSRRNVGYGGPVVRGLRLGYEQRPFRRAGPSSPWRKSYRDESGSFPPPLRCRTPGILPVFWGLGALI